MLSVTDKEFETNILLKSKTQLIIVSFSAPWCAPCKILSPILEEVSETLKEKVEVVKINVDNDKQYAEKYGITSIPTLLWIKNEEVLRREQGIKSKEALLAITEQYR